MVSMAFRPLLDPWRGSEVRWGARRRAAPEQACCRL